jgi:hypothetical protein
MRVKWAVAPDFAALNVGYTLRAFATLCYAGKKGDVRLATEF